MSTLASPFTNAGMRIASVFCCCSTLAWALGFEVARVCQHAQPALELPDRFTHLLSGLEQSELVKDVALFLHRYPLYLHQG